MFSYCQLVCSHVSVAFEICLESHLFETFLNDSWLTAVFFFSFDKCPFCCCLHVLKSEPHLKLHSILDNGLNELKTIILCKYVPNAVFLRD